MICKAVINNNKNLKSKLVEYEKEMKNLKENQIQMQHQIEKL